MIIKSLFASRDFLLSELSHFHCHKILWLLSIKYRGPPSNSQIMNSLVNVVDKQINTTTSPVFSMITCLFMSETKLK